MITTVRASACSAIQSSAASNSSDTTTRSISGWSGTRRQLLLTTRHRHFAAPGDLVDLVLHRAGVGVDQDLDVAHGLAAGPRVAGQRDPLLVDRHDVADMAADFIVAHAELSGPARASDDDIVAVGVSLPSWGEMATTRAVAACLGCTGMPEK